MTRVLEAAIIHPSAVVSPSARLGIGVIIGPGVVIGPEAVVGHYSVIGGMPEHKAFLKDDPEKPSTFGVVVRPGARIFEFVTIHSGATMPTTICENALVFNHSHVAHDCWIGPEAIVGGQVSLAGHTTLLRSSTVSGKSCTHQFAVLGAYSFLGAASYLMGSVPPGEKWMGNPARAAGGNDVGLERAGLSVLECKHRHDEEFELALKGIRL